MLYVDSSAEFGWRDNHSGLEFRSVVSTGSSQREYCVFLCWIGSCMQLVLAVLSAKSFDLVQTSTAARLSMAPG